MTIQCVAAHYFLLSQILNLHFHLSSGNTCEYRSKLLYVNHICVADIFFCPLPNITITSGQVSTWMGDCMGIPGVADFLLSQIIFTYHQETLVSIGASYCLRPYNGKHQDWVTLFSLTFSLIIRNQPHVESTSSRLITAVKPNLARLVLG